MEFSSSDMEKKLDDYRRRYMENDRENKHLCGQTTEKTKEFLQSTKEMRLNIENQLAELDEGDIRNVQRLTSCLQDRIRQCDDTLANLMHLKERILAKPAVDPNVFRAINNSLRYPEIETDLDYEKNEYSERYDLRSPPRSNQYAHNIAQYSLTPNYRQLETCNRPPINYNRSTSEYAVRNHGTTASFLQEYKTTRSFLNSQDLDKDNVEPHVTGFTKFCSNISELQQILNENAKEREKHIQRIEKFCKGKDTMTCGNPKPPINPTPPVSPTASCDWGTELEPTKPPCTQTICCGPSKLRPLFDAKIQKLEQLIVRHCFEIKEKNILIEQCCRAKEVLICQKQNLHNILQKLCEKIKQLERKLYRIKIAVCCPNFPVNECTTTTGCKDEIMNLRRLEEKVETLYNGIKHKECLLKICQKSIEVLKADKSEWVTNINDMEKIKTELEYQLEQMKARVCKRVSDQNKPKPMKYEMSESTSSVKSDHGDAQIETSDESSPLDDYLSKDYNSEMRSFRSGPSVTSKQLNSVQVQYQRQFCKENCKCKRSKRD